jgi:ribosome-binding factor A
VIQRELTSLLTRGKLKDPRIAELTTITGVDLTRDLSLATVYYTVMGGDEATIQQTGEGLEAARGFLQRHLARVLDVRTLPTLRFRHDTSFDEGEKIERLLAGLPELSGDPERGQEE